MILSSQTFRYVWKLREKAEREKRWRASVPRAGSWFRFVLTDGHVDRYPNAMPFNDYWYYADKLEKAGANEEALWFYRGALLRSKVERAILPQIVRKIEETVQRLSVSLSQEGEERSGGSDFKE